MVTYYVKLNEIYTITATDECRVYNASGVQVATCPANESINVKAATAKLKLSDDNAAIKKAVSESGGGTSEECEQHIANADIHTTSAEKLNCSNHIANGDVHVTSAEKTKITNAAQTNQSNNYTGRNYFFDCLVGYDKVLITDANESNPKAALQVIKLGTKTALGADAYGLSVSASGGLQLFGTHFLLGDIFNDNSLKIVSNNLSMYSTDEAAISFDYANRAVFRSMPNDGTEGTYEFQCWQWADDSHTSKKGVGVKLLKASQVSELEDYSVLNKAECDSLYARLTGANTFTYANTFKGGTLFSSTASFTSRCEKSTSDTLNEQSLLNKSELDANYAPKTYDTANAILITDGNGNVTASTVISVSELNTLNNNVTNIKTKLADLEARLAALEA